MWCKVEPNQEFQGLVCEGANVLPAKFVQDSFRDGYGMFFLLQCTLITLFCSEVGLFCSNFAHKIACLFLLNMLIGMFFVLGFGCEIVCVVSGVRRLDFFSREVRFVLFEMCS